MTDTTHITQRYTYIAIDIAKKSHDALIQWPSGKRKAMKIANILDDLALDGIAMNVVYLILCGNMIFEESVAWQNRKRLGLCSPGLPQRKKLRFATTTADL